MHVSSLVWIVSILVVLGLFVFDFFSHVRTPHEPTLKESGLWTVVYISLAMVFGIGVYSLRWKQAATKRALKSKTEETDDV